MMGKNRKPKGCEDHWSFDVEGKRPLGAIQGLGAKGVEGLRLVLWQLLPLGLLLLQTFEIFVIWVRLKM